MSDKSGSTILKFLSHLGFSGDMQSHKIFMCSLWVAKILEVGMFTSAYIQEGQMGKKRRDIEGI